MNNMIIKFEDTKD